MEDQRDVTYQTETLLNIPWQVSGQSEGAAGGSYRGKRWLDVTLGLVIFIFSAPIMALVAIAIRLDSKGPILFLQERVGYDPGTCRPRLFKVYKFRTMQDNCDQEVHRAYVSGLIEKNTGPAKAGSSLKMGRDMRITRVGRFLRKTSLDELPQLINVLRGEMSLVGPRPALPYEVALYKDWQLERLHGMPGMTGWWQVAGRNRVAFEEMVRMDIYYVQHMSLGFDLRILLLTPFAVLSTRGAG